MMAKQLSFRLQNIQEIALPAIGQFNSRVLYNFKMNSDRLVNYFFGSRT